MSLFTYIFYWIWIAFLFCLAAIILLPIVILVAPIYFIGLIAFMMMG